MRAAYKAKACYPEALVVDARNEALIAGADRLCERLVLERDFGCDLVDRFRGVLRVGYRVSGLGCAFLELGR